ncbi:hypothetical protein [Paenibacillus taichungensis]|uniref:hypothetical protein n=1 Tax=Paenibacillus taichungensis TaxID=484184 RepID=UPI002870C431|nr:hypothetical protein [Paenibacillus taichungensis]MDR9744427.1 hypothetical protein [Paenibacillus taichungensis]
MTKSILEVQAVFMDRDGTIGGTGHFIHPRDFELYPNAKEAIMLLKTSGIKVDLISPIYVHMNKNAAAESRNLVCCYMLQSNTIWIYQNA